MNTQCHDRKANNGIRNSMLHTANGKREREKRERTRLFDKIKSLYNIYKIKKNRVVRRLSLRLDIAASATATKKNENHGIIDNS